MSTCQAQTYLCIDSTKFFLLPQDIDFYWFNMTLIKKIPLRSWSENTSSWVMNNSWQNDFLSFKLFKFILKGKNGSSQNIIRFFNYLLTLSSNHLVRLWFAAAIDKPIFLLNWPSSPQLFCLDQFFPPIQATIFAILFKADTNWDQGLENVKLKKEIQRHFLVLKKT